MNKRTALPIVIACTALGCSAPDTGGEGPDFSVPAFSGTTPNTATAPGAGQNASNPASQGNAAAPGTPNGQGRVNEGTGTAGQLAPAAAGSTAGAPTATAPSATPAAAGTPAALDVTIQAETLNQTVSKGFGIEPTGTAVGGI